MGGISAVIYGAAAYAVFFATILYAIGFVGSFAVPKAIDTPTGAPWAGAVAVDVGLLLLFAVQHSVMARQGFKRMWTRVVPKAVERSTYVLFASVVLLVLFWQWESIPAIAWQVKAPGAALAINVASGLGWALVFLSTFLINHFELFGLRQVFARMMGHELPAPEFRTPFLYKRVRHPLYLGFILAFWAAPTMTYGHLLFAAVTTAYILVAIVFEERDLIAHFGEQYLRYREDVPMILPLPRPKRRAPTVAPKKLRTL